MKKLLALLMAFILTLALVGCGSLNDEELLERMRDLGSPTTEYLERRIDELEQENIDLWEALNDRYVQMEIGDDNLYFHCTVDGMVKECESVNYQDQIDELELIIDNLEEIIFENERRLDELGEDTQIDYSMLDDIEDYIEILIYYYEHTDRVVDFQTYISTNYPSLYERVNNYYD